MNRDKLKNETFLGLVVDNNDPKKLGRCKVRVFQVFDKLETQDIPWAMPWKDLNGNEFTVPEVGKYVSVVFDQGNKYTPEYIYAQNFNVNLERKLQSLTGEDYTTMRAVLFDQSTQLYRNKTEGLKIDHEFTNINLDKDGNILMNLRDTQSVICLGSRDAEENSVLGKTFMGWMDNFVSALMGKNGSPYIDSLGGPCIPSPGLVRVIEEYAQLREDFLSNHVYLPQNNRIYPQVREYVNQTGDVGAPNVVIRDVPYYPEKPSGDSAEVNQVTSQKDLEGVPTTTKPNANPAVVKVKGKNTAASIDLIKTIESANPRQPGRGGYPVVERDVYFAQKWTNGILPGILLEDYTYKVSKAEGTRSYLTHNPGYQKFLTPVTIPMANKNVTVLVHPDLGARMKLVMDEVIRLGLQQYILSAATWVVRNVTNGTRLSHHSWGMAIDLNPVLYPYGFNFFTQTSSKGKDFDQGFIQVGKLFTKNGVAWYRSKDAMHFSVNEFGVVKPDGN